MEDIQPLCPLCVHLGYLEDDAVRNYIQRAQTRLRFMGPGCSKAVAEAIVCKWELLGADAVEIVLEADAELCRIGYGDGEALKLIRSAASQLGRPVYQQQGIRLCVLEIDDERIIYAPTPRLVEAASSSSQEILLSPKNEPAIKDQILSPRDGPLQLLAEAAVATVTEELKRCPPLPFDVSRQVRVLSTRFQFVEFSLEHTALTRMRAKLPTELLGLTNEADSTAKDLLHASFQLIAKGDDVSGESLRRRRKEIETRYTISVGPYGRIILQDNREAFEKEIAALRAEVQAFQKEAEAKLAEAIERNCQLVTDQIFPVVLRKFPERWTAQLGSHPAPEALRAKLAAVLREAFGQANVHLDKMKVGVIFKDVTASMVRDSHFVELAARSGLNINALHEEYQAARTRMSVIEA